MPTQSEVTRHKRAIIDALNLIANRINSEIEDGDLVETDNFSVPALINIETGRGYVQVQVFSDTEIRVEISDQLSNLLEMPTEIKLRNEDEVIEQVQAIQDALKEWGET